jgi:NADH dehydrogenase (ubiquinone) 1 alpha/beta subcomplex 1
LKKLTLDAHFYNDLGLDSLDQVEIVIAVEEEFNIEFSDKDSDEILSGRIAAEKVRCLTLVRPLPPPLPSHQ